MKYLIPLALLLVACDTLPAGEYPRVPRLPMATVLKYELERGNCSAVAMTHELAVTARHCLEEAFLGVLYDSQGVGYRVARATPHPNADIALLEVEDRLPVESMPAQEPPGLGDLIWTAGYGCLKAQIMVSPGSWAGIPGERETFQIMGTACAGDSGGPVWNARGDLIGVMSAKHRTNLPLAWVTPLHHVLDLLPAP
jgi:hypothetical protein